MQRGCHAPPGHSINNGESASCSKVGLSADHDCRSGGGGVRSARGPRRRAVVCARLYPQLQAVATSVSNRVPVALFDVAVIVLAIVALVTWIHSIRVARRKRSIGRLAAASWRPLTLAALIYLWFLAAWGLNYARQPIESVMPYDASRVTPPPCARSPSTPSRRPTARTPPRTPPAFPAIVGHAAAARHRAAGRRARARPAAHHGGRAPEDTRSSRRSSAPRA